MSERIAQKGINIRQSDCRNRLLSIMSEEDFASLAEELAPIDLPLNLSLAEPNEPIEYIYFLEDGVASLIADANGVKVEAGLIGREGFTVPALALDAAQVPHGSRMQVPGCGYRIRREAFVKIIEFRPPLLHLMLRFAQCLLIQTCYTALSNAVHELDVRLARWLLMMHDRSSSDDLLTTHDFMSIMLGVRRPSVTVALHKLEGQKFIQAERGCIFVRNRAGLQEFAGEAYGIPEREYRRLIGPLD